MNIRIYRPDEFSDIIVLQDEFINEFFPEIKNDPIRKDIEKDIRDINSYYSENGNIMWVIENEDNVIGMGGLINQGNNTFEIKRLRISTNYRNQGLGSELLEWIENYCRKNGVKRIYLDTTNRNSGAIRFYKKHGYKEYKRERIDTDFGGFFLHYFEKYLTT